MQKDLVFFVQPIWAAIDEAVTAPVEMDAHERVLGDAKAGDATLFARHD